MPHSRILAIFALLACIFATPVIAQVIQAQKVPRPLAVPDITPRPVAQDPTADAARKVMTIEEARARIAELTREKRAMKARLDETLAQIEQMTSRSGSLVRAYCESDTLSRNTAGASENCAQSGYQCASVEGTCHRKCNVSTQCAVGFVCETGAQRCVRP